MNADITQYLLDILILKFSQYFSDSFSLVLSTKKPYFSESKDTLLENVFGKNESHQLEYYLNESLQVAGIYCT